MIRRLLLLAVLCLLGVGQASGQGVRRDDVVLRGDGRPAAGATIRVCTSASTNLLPAVCTPTASIFSDRALAQAKTNPFNADQNGNYFFYAAEARYRIQITVGSFTFDQPDVILPCEPGVSCGGADGGFTHTQSVAATVWTIVHNFNTLNANCEFYNGSNNVIYPDLVTQTDLNTVTANFTIAQSGKAVCFGSGVTSVGYGTVQDEGVGLNQRTTLNMIGGGVTCVDASGSGRTDCSIPGATSGVGLGDNNVWTGTNKFDRTGSTEVSIPTTLSNSCTDCSNETLGSTDAIDDYRFKMLGDKIWRFTKKIASTVDLSDATLPNSQKANGLLLALESSVAATGGNSTGQKLVSPLTIKTQVNSDAATSVPHLGVQSILYARNNAPAEHASGYFFSLCGLSPTDANCGSAGIWGLDVHVMKPNAASPDGIMKGIEIGMHKAPALGAALNAALHIHSGNAEPVTAATRAGDAIFIEGNAGWTNYLNIKNTAGVVKYQIAHDGTANNDININHIGTMLIERPTGQGQSLQLRGKATPNFIVIGPEYLNSAGTAFWDWRFDPDNNQTNKLALRDSNNGVYAMVVRQGADTVFGGRVAVVPTASALAYSFPTGPVGGDFLVSRQTGDVGAIFFGTDSTARNFLLWDGPNTRFQMQIVSAGDLLLSAVTGAMSLNLTQPGAKIKAASNNVRGTVSTSAATSGSTTFTVAWTSAPICVLTPTSDVGSGVRFWVTTSTTAVTVNTDVSTTKTFNYVCVGNPD